MVFKTVGLFLWKSAISYIARRSSGEFMDSVFDTALTTFAKSTKSTVDDELVAKWKISKAK